MIHKGRSLCFVCILYVYDRHASYPELVSPSSSSVLVYVAVVRVFSCVSIGLCDFALNICYVVVVLARLAAMVRHWEQHEDYWLDYR